MSALITPQAFPTSSSSEKGMTLRDYFAATALNGFLASETKTAKSQSLGESAMIAYKYADAMLAERVKDSK